MSESNVINVETSQATAQSIQKETGVPHEIMIERLDRCARKEGLEKGYFSPDQDIKRVLDAAGFKANRIDGVEVPLRVQLNMYLQMKYADYIWRGYNPRHCHDQNSAL